MTHNFFPVTFPPKYHTGCINHCCIIVGKHDVDVHVPIPLTNDWCEFPTYCCLHTTSGFLNFSIPNLVLAGLAISPSSDELESSSSPGHGNFLCLFQENSLVYVGGRVVRLSWVNFQGRGILLIWIIVGQGPIALEVGAGGGYLDIFTLVYLFTSLFPLSGRRSDID